MRFIIKSKEIEISEDLKSYIEKRIGKIEKFLENVEPDLIEVTIEVAKTVGGQKQGEIYEIHTNLNFPGKLLRSEVKDEDLYSAVDSAQEELEREIRKFKTKKETLFRRGARSFKKQYGLSPLARFRKK